jgi:PPOX class probable F420-dependent enzyme
VAKSLEGPALALVKDKNFVHLSMTREDGTIQGVVVWADADDDGNLVLNSSEGRAWPANLRRTGQATVTVANAANPYEFAAITASLAGDTHEGAGEQIDALAKKYLGVDKYPFLQEGEQRISFTLRPERIYYQNGS